MNIIGLISGTSVDGIDAALVNISGSTLDLQVRSIATNTYPYPAVLREQILAVCGGAALSMAALAQLDDAIAQTFAEAAIAIQVNQPPAELIGSHGQTVFHRPPHPQSQTLLGYSVQLGRGALIAELTRITTISNFRAADIAAAGQGAPLVPPIDACLFSHPTEHRCVQNIGGIGNVAYLPATASLTSEDFFSKVKGWDTGPGNSLLDLAVTDLSQGKQTFDHNGAWAAQGTPCLPLVERWLAEEFFRQLPPKSTGRELFGWEYVQQCFRAAAEYDLSAADILASLTELTAASIAQEYRQFLPRLPDRVVLCGGGSHNQYLQQRIQANLGAIPLTTTDALGVPADAKEAIAFAVLAYWRSRGIAGNIPSVTGARQKILLGDIYLPL
jgi:anhydro-N-acetylmuramic acid kinase